MKQIRLCLTVAAACVATLSFASVAERAGAGDEFTVRAATVAPAGTPWEVQLKAFKKYAEKESGGRLKVKTFMGGSLGGEKALVRRVAQGSIEVFGGSTGAMGSLVEALNVIESPFLFDSYEQADKVLDGPTRDTIKSILEKKGFVFTAWSENGFRSWFAKEKAIKTPADLKGLRMRAQESNVHIATYKAFGASPVPIDITNVLTSLQTGVVDGFDNSPLYAFAASWYQAVKHATLSKHCYQPGIVVYSKRWLDTLPDDLQKILRNVPAQIEKDGRQGVRSMEPVLVQNLKRAGIDVWEPSAAELEPFKKATAKVADASAKKGGADAVALLKQIRENL
jgi:tripartite ATP-independent transporter DctP family solute receptor